MKNLLAQIVDAADALTEPHQHAEPIYDYDKHRPRLRRRTLPKRDIGD